MIEKTTFLDFDAIKIINEKNDELIVLTEIGPRIVSFRPQGKDNFFYVNEKELKKEAKGSDSWHMYGGTRFWISPESEMTYAPDNVEAETVIANNTVTIISPVNKMTKLRKTIYLEAKEKTFSITCELKNEGTHLFTAGLWVISCLQPSKLSEFYLPWGENSTWNVKDMKYWKSWLGVQSNIESEQWNPMNEFFIIRPSGEIGKVGFANHWGFALFCTKDITFIKKTNYIESAQYPDGGCSYEVYTSEDFYELETLSPLYTIKPGMTFTHKEEWWAGTQKVELGSIYDASKFISRTFPTNL